MISVIARGLALALVDGEWQLQPLRARAQSALGCKPRWLTPLLRRVLKQFPQSPADLDELVDLIYEDELLHAAIARSKTPIRIHRWFFPQPVMIPVAGPPAAFPVPAIDSRADLAARLQLRTGELEWFADAKRLNQRAAKPRLRHYHYRWVVKRSAGYRLLETPKRRIKAVQRALVRDILTNIPASEQAHGFVAGRSVHSFAAPHVGKRIVVRLDLCDFFTAIGHARVAAMLRRVGYPRRVATTLACLCTTPTPEDVLQQHPRARADLASRFATLSRLRVPHLPQGAPTSPALSNLAALGLDRRLAGIAKTVDAAYTRYADDLVFSGGAQLARGVTRFIHIVGAIALDEGFEVNFRKTRVMRSGRRQQTAGLVLNQRANIKRSDYDALRATLYNAARFGPASQNRNDHPRFRAHLLGRISWVATTSPSRGARLRRLFDAIVW